MKNTIAISPATTANVSAILVAINLIMKPANALPILALILTLSQGA